MAPNRRDFLKQTGLASAGILVPSFIKASVPFLPGDVRPKVLVMIQFTGGNDGLNCIVPIGNDLYHKARPNIGYKKEELI
ncbi:MAG TPA: twin-arginine translocation signal domain-containing protein, partial [Chitinophagales bacterium]|nr:twin-arginine translocation signal domain-containing protein [Chitinophagales bacterium]